MINVTVFGMMADDDQLLLYNNSHVRASEPCSCRNEYMKDSAVRTRNCPVPIIKLSFRMLEPLCDSITSV